MLTREEAARMPRSERLERLVRTAHELDEAIADQAGVVLCHRPDARSWAP